ncbi:hypothetical protein NQZ68_033366 [Dissostichus eleginoides]|nr:hypothetical protein NQZ68_033366 [Dissostichus eleginoides]
MRERRREKYEAGSPEPRRIARTAVRSADTRVDSSKLLLGVISPQDAVTVSGMSRRIIICTDHGRWSVPQPAHHISTGREGGETKAQMES